MATAVNHGSTASSARPNGSWLLERLNTLARKRSARPDARTQAEYTSALSGFSEAAVRRACEELEAEEIGPHATRWPELSRLTGLCRRFQPRASTEWTLDRFAAVHNFDRWVDEQVRDGKDREELLRAHPAMRVMWVAFRNQVDRGTIQVPAGWCARCEGRRWLAADENGQPWTDTRVSAAGLRPCPDCRGAGVA